MAQTWLRGRPCTVAGRSLRASLPSALSAPPALSPSGLRLPARPALGARATPCKTADRTPRGLQPRALAQTWLRDRPCPVAGRSLRPSWPPLARTRLRFAIHGSACRLRRLSEHGRPLAESPGGVLVLSWQRPGSPLLASADRRRSPARGALWPRPPRWRPRPPRSWPGSRRTDRAAGGWRGRGRADSPCGRGDG